MTSVGLPSVGLPAFPEARQPRPIRTFVQGGALAAAISLSLACGLGFRRPTQHLKQMASAVNRVSEPRFPAETLKQRAAGGHQSSWFELIPPLREKNRRRLRIARDYLMNAHD